MKRDPKKNLLEHSAAKVLLLEKYLQKYLNIISHDNYTQKVFLFDLFCSEGLYENGGEGSPLVMLRLAKDLYFQNKAIKKDICKIDLFFNDEDSEKIEKLKGIIKEKKLFLSDIGSLQFGKETYENVLPKVIKFINSLRSHKAFVFIDPYGYREIRASQIKELLKNRKTEVLLFLPTQFMYRFDEKGTPQALIEIIEELVDYKDWKPTGSVLEFIAQFTESLRNFLGEEYFVDTFLIQKDANTVFCLFFFSSHIRGFEKMLETKWELDEENGKGYTFDKQGDLFAVQKLIDYEEKLMRYLSEFRSNGDLYIFSLRNGFLPKHTNSILKKMEAKEKIISKEEKRKNAFYITYENFRESPAKIKIKLV